MKMAILNLAINTIMTLCVSIIIGIGFLIKPKVNLLNKKYWIASNISY